MSLADQSDDNRLKIFLCYSRQDKETVRAIYHRLKAEGFQPWLDGEDLEPGQNRQLEISNAIKASDIFLVCLSRTFVTTEGFGQKEIKLALDKHAEMPEGEIFPIPLLLEELSSDELPPSLRTLQWVKYFKEKGFASLVRALHNQAKRKGKQASPDIQDTPNLLPDSVPLNNLLGELAEAKTIKDWNGAVESIEQQRFLELVEPEETVSVETGNKPRAVLDFKRLSKWLGKFTGNN